MESNVRTTSLYPNYINQYYKLYPGLLSSRLLETEQITNFKHNNLETVALEEQRTLSKDLVGQQVLKQYIQYT
jgi:hypothetical protein